MLLVRVSALCFFSAVTLIVQCQEGYPAVRQIISRDIIRIVGGRPGDSWLTQVNLKETAVKWQY